LDLSQNPVLSEIFCSVNQLVNLDVRNGNNANFTTFVADQNNLTCISVDDELADHSGWVVDPGVTFSNACDEHVYIPDANFEQALIDTGIDSDGTLNQMILRADAEAADSLIVDGYGISDLTGVEAFTNITLLTCTNNLLQTLDVSNNTLLLDIRCESNQLISMDLSANTALVQLWCGYNQISSLNITSNTNLTGLSCYFNELSSLDVSNNTGLHFINCYENNLTSLDVSNNTLLGSLRCYGNQLTQLELTNNPNLNVLRCENNNLSELDVRNGNNENVTLLNATNNNLNCISVDDEASSHIIDCSPPNPHNCQPGPWLVDEDVVLSNDCGLTHSGAYIIQGTVTSSEDGSTLAGVSIVEQGTSNDVVTSLAGEYAVTVTGDGAVLIVSLVGYVTEVIHVGNRETVNIILTPDLGFAPIGDGSTIVDGNVTLYPNPVVDWLTLEFTDESVNLIDVTIHVYDDWAILYTVTIQESVSVYGYEIDFNPLLSGTYYVQLYDGIEVRVFRIVK
jgi:Leucine-rich repeat (LRR) protein